jgi:hypothetical protein
MQIWQQDEESRGGTIQRHGSLERGAGQYRVELGGWSKLWSGVSGSELKRGGRAAHWLIPQQSGGGEAGLGVRSLAMKNMA